jgi:hypothetical protein
MVYDVHIKLFSLARGTTEHVVRVASPLKHKAADRAVAILRRAGGRGNATVERVVRVQAERQRVIKLGRENRRERSTPGGRARGPVDVLTLACGHVQRRPFADVPIEGRKRVSCIACTLARRPLDSVNHQGERDACHSEESA